MLSVLTNSKFESLRSEFNSNDTLYVTPSPIEADSFRKKINDGSKIVTIANWISSFEVPKDKKFASKAELYLRLGALFNKYFKEGGISLFEKSYNLFSEIKSFGFNEDVTKSLISLVEPTLAKATLFYFEVLKIEGLVDEQDMYSYYQKDNSIKSLVFLGFKNLSARQIDFLRSISNDQNIHIIIPDYLVDKFSKNDWLGWLPTPEGCSGEMKKITLKLLRFKTGNLQAIIANLKNNRINLAFFEKPSLEMAQSYMQGDDKLKVSVNIFENVFSEVSFLVDECIINNSDLLGKIEEFKISSLREANFLKFKVLELFEKTFKIISEYEVGLSKYSFELCRQVVGLSLPRNNLLSRNHDARINFLSIEEIKNVANESVEQSVLVIEKENLRLSSNSNEFGDAFYKALIELAPIKNRSLDIWFKMADYLTICERGGSVLCLEEGAEEDSFIIKTLLENHLIEQVELERSKTFRPENNLFNSIKKAKKFENTYFSPASIQAYVDCPQKFFQNYIEKNGAVVASTVDLEKFELGTIEHDVIRQLFEGKISSPNEIDIFVKNYFDNYLSANKKRLDMHRYLDLLSELKHCARNGLKVISEEIAGKEYKAINFEFGIQPLLSNYKGRIDVCIEYLDAITIIDFKRSKGSIPDKKECLSFSDVQMWIYSLAFEKVNKSIKFQFVSLLDEDGKQEFEISNDSLMKFRDYLSSIETEIKNDDTFVVKPRNHDVCNFCTISEICPRGGLNEQV